MALPITIPYTFANATSSIPLSNLDADFTTVVNAINGIGNGTVGLTTITSPAATALTIQSAGTTAMTVDTSQNVGIGTTSPSSAAKLTLAGTSTNSALIVYNNTAAAGTGLFGSVAAILGSGTSNDLAIGALGSNNMTFYTGANERMRIDTSGNLLVGTTSFQYGYTAEAVQISRVGGYIIVSHASTANTNMMVFNNGNGQVGSINSNGTSTSYNTSSDYRLKKNVTPMTTGLMTISALKPVIYKWNVDDSDGEGFIAHELAEVVPLAVSGEKDAVAEDGTIRPQGVDYSKIVVHLVAAIQELSAKNDALEARLAALEAK
jgi:hypothetical protein